MSRFLSILAAFLGFGGDLRAEWGEIEARLSPKDSPIPTTGASLRLGDDLVEFPESGVHKFSLLPPGKHVLKVAWPKAGISESRTVEVTEGKTTTVDFDWDFPKPQIVALRTPVVNRARVLVIEGKYFLHSAGAPYQVRINGKSLSARRVSDERIELAPSVTTDLLKALGKKLSDEAVIEVIAGGLSSNPAKLALLANLPGRIVGRVNPDAPRLSVRGATVSIIGTPLKATVDSRGIFAFREIRPGTYQAKLDWPGLGLQEEFPFQISSDGTTPVTFKVTVPQPELLRVSPSRVDSPSAITLHGKNFLYKAQALYEVRIGNQVVSARRLSETTIQISSTQLEPLFQGQKAGETLNRTVALSIAGVSTKALPLVLKVPIPPENPRDLATSKEPAPPTPAPKAE